MSDHASILDETELAEIDPVQEALEKFLDEIDNLCLVYNDVLRASKDFAESSLYGMETHNEIYVYAIAAGREQTQITLEQIQNQYPFDGLIIPEDTGDYETMNAFFMQVLGMQESALLHTTQLSDPQFKLRRAFRSRTNECIREGRAEEGETLLNVIDNVIGGRVVSSAEDFGKTTRNAATAGRRFLQLLEDQNGNADEKETITQLA